MNVPSYLKQPKDGGGEKKKEKLGYKTLDFRQQMTVLGRTEKQGDG